MSLSDPTLDSDGYPTEATLKVIREWSISTDWQPFMEFILKVWKWSHYQSTYPYDDEITKGTAYLISTGGWSGNEDLIQAMGQNKMFWMMCWQRSERGGHYLFVAPKESDDVPI